eukprot:gb/GECG01007133.1/.p1 GENE.gb/GECG01007133.1/~~gb/GECG01007133.1/.p1  ORF type:complete len:486 (+),score=75.98 gb/GECG01007133.1/:1-1458(+)
MMKRSERQLMVVYASAYFYFIQYGGPRSITLCVCLKQARRSPFGLKLGTISGKCLLMAGLYSIGMYLLYSPFDHQLTLIFPFRVKLRKMDLAPVSFNAPAPEQHQETITPSYEHIASSREYQRPQQSSASERGGLEEEDELVGVFGEEFPFFEDSVDYQGQLGYLRTLDDENRTSFTDELGQYSYETQPTTDGALGALQSLPYKKQEGAQSDTTKNGTSKVANGKPEDGAPAKFVQVLYEILENPNNESIISWEGEDGFVIRKHDTFTEQLLPYLCNSSSFCSFIRQLNGYGFSKSDPRRSYFKHPVFRKGRPDLLKYIKRRRAAKRKTGTKDTKDHDTGVSAEPTTENVVGNESTRKLHPKENGSNSSGVHSSNSSEINALSAGASALAQMVSFCLLQAREMPKLSSSEAEIHWRYFEEVQDSSLRFLKSVGVSVPQREGKLSILEALLETLREFDPQHPPQSVDTSEPTAVSEWSPSRNVAGH